MKRSGKRTKLNNGGFSLVEVLVTMTVIAVLSVPIMQSFMSTARVNRKARCLQNATDIAQNVAEYFDAVSVPSLSLAYSGITLSDGTIVYPNVGDGIHVDENGVGYYLGQDDEKFYVTVILDPTDFSDETDSSGINDYVKPVFNNLTENKSVTCLNHFTEHDSSIINAFKMQYPTELSTKDIQKKDIEKSSTIRIYQSLTGDNKIFYEYYLDVVYTYGAYKVEYNDIQLAYGTIDKVQSYAPNLYLVYSPFDVYAGNPVARDNITIKYMTDYVSETDWERYTNVYLIQQNVHYGDNVNDAVLLNPNRINVQYHGTTTTGSYNNEGSKLGIYTNLDSFGDGQALTTGTDSMTTLYTMSIYIRNGECDTTDYVPDKTGEITLSDFYTSVSTVKEE